LKKAGLEQVVDPVAVIGMPRPTYSVDAQPGTRLRNGPELRRFNLDLSEHVHAAITKGHFPFVVGGDCSILLGALAGARRHERLSLVHLDGHSDFRHPGNYDAQATLGAVAGMDLALVTGRGEQIMTQWPGVDSPLVPDAQVVQIGERESRDPDFPWPDINQTEITRVDIFELREEGLSNAMRRAHAVLDHVGWRYWLHLDVDVLDQQVMPAVDSPGSPGLDMDEVMSILRSLLSPKCVGLTLTIFDPDLDPDGTCARVIVEILDQAFRSLVRT
jgi:arginase